MGQRSTCVACFTLPFHGSRPCTSAVPQAAVGTCRLISPNFACCQSICRACCAASEGPHAVQHGLPPPQVGSTKLHLGRLQCLLTMSNEEGSPMRVASERNAPIAAFCNCGQKVRASRAPPLVDAVACQVPRCCFATHKAACGSHDPSSMHADTHRKTLPTPGKACKSNVGTSASGWRPGCEGNSPRLASRMEGTCKDHKTIARMLRRKCRQRHNWLPRTAAQNRLLQPNCSSPLRAQALPRTQASHKAGNGNRSKMLGYCVCLVAANAELLHL